MVSGTHEIFLTGYQFRVSKNGDLITSELAAFEAITFTGTFGPLLWEKFYPVKESQPTVEIDTHWLSKRTKWQSAIYPVRRSVFAQYFLEEMILSTAELAKGNGTQKEPLPLTCY